MPFALVGIGLGGGRLISHEAQDRLDRADAVFVIEPEAVARPMFERVKGRLISMDPVFDEITDRGKALEVLAQRVFDLAKEYAAPVLALQGHPMVSCAPARHLLRMFGDRGEPVDVYAGLSSIDMLWADLGFDPVSTGVQIVNGAQVSRLGPTMPAVILSPGYAPRSVAFKDRLAATAEMVARLISLWGDGAEFIIYRRTLDGPRFERLTVGNLVGIAARPFLGDILLAGPATFFPALPGAKEVAGHEDWGAGACLAE
jgi:precorrin-6B methylase 1